MGSKYRYPMKYFFWHEILLPFLKETASLRKIQPAFFFSHSLALLLSCSLWHKSTKNIHTKIPLKTHNYQLNLHEGHRPNPPNASHTPRHPHLQHHWIVGVGVCQFHDTFPSSQVQPKWQLSNYCFVVLTKLTGQPWPKHNGQVASVGVGGAEGDQS